MAEIIVGEKIVNKLNQVGTILFILSDHIMWSDFFNESHQKIARVVKKICVDETLKNLYTLYVNKKYVHWTKGENYV